MTPTEQLKLDLERAQWTTLVWGLLTGFSGMVLKEWHSWWMLMIPVLMLGLTCWWAVRVLRLRRQLKTEAAG